MTPYPLKIGILGGGQLGRMLIKYGLDSDIEFRVLDTSENAPAAGLASYFQKGDFTDYDQVIKFAEECDILTIEIENVNTAALKAAVKQGKRVFPQPEVIETIKNKVSQKQFYADNQIPTSDFEIIEYGQRLKRLSGNVIVKQDVGGYDGRGVWAAPSDRLNLPAGSDHRFLIEEKIQIDRELSVLVAADYESGRVEVYDAVEMAFDSESHILKYQISPARITAEQLKAANCTAVKVAKAFKITGLLAVELFLTESGEILVNEAAPRPHNSGHHTIEAAGISQFEMLTRIIAGYGPVEPRLVKPSVMINLLGSGKTGPVVYKGIESLLAGPGVFIHIYGKRESRPGRKMGHITVLGETVKEAIDRASELKNIVTIEGR